MYIWVTLGAISAFFTYGIVFGYGQNKYKKIAKANYSINVVGAIVLSLMTLVFPPLIVLVYIVFDFGKHGLRWK